MISCDFRLLTEGLIENLGNLYLRIAINEIQKSFIKLNTKQAIAMVRMNPKAVLPGENPRLIDERQKAPDIWNQVKDDLDIK